MLRLRVLTAFLCGLALLPALPGAAEAQDEDRADEHAGHAMSMSGAAAGGWIMPPMDPNMPMLPGMEGAIPPVSAWLPEFDLDPADFPVAQPSRSVFLADGDTLHLDVSPVRRTIAGHEYLMYGYDGQYPGPLIRAERGSTVFVQVSNEIPSPTTVHWHGVRLDSRFDGVPGLSQPPVGPGESFLYEVHVPDAGMFWYHPHVREDVQQDLGLYGNLLVLPVESAGAGGGATDGRPEEGTEGGVGGATEAGGASRVEGGTASFHREELLALDDLLVAADGGLVPYGVEAPVHALMGRYGNVLLANGVADHRMEVERGEVVRFHLTNVASARPFNVQFGNRPAKLVATDVGPYERESWVESVVISPAERYSVDVRFPESGTVAITNTIQAVNHFRGTFYPQVDTLALVEVGEEEVSPDLAAAHETLAERPDVTRDIDRFRSHFDREPDRELTTTLRVRDLPGPIVLSMDADTFYAPHVEWNDAMPMMNWLATGDQVEWILEDTETGLRNQEIHWRFRQGDVVKIRLFNEPSTFHPMQHPIHIHGQRFLVVARDGVPQENLAWKDTALLPVGSTMDLLVEMSNPGDWMMHCHIAEHLSAGMHFHFTVDPE